MDIQLPFTVRMAELVNTLADTNFNDSLVKFVMALDARVADMDFTVALYAALGDVIRQELVDPSTQEL